MDKEAPSSKNDQYKKPKRKGRGATTGLKAKGQNNGPKHIKFDKFGRPFGAGRLAFSRDIGDIARNNIKITYEDWFKVPEGIKDSIWQDIKCWVNHNILITNIPIGSLLYGVLAAVVYDSNSGSTHKISMVTDIVICMGRQCYYWTFMWWACLSVLGVVSSILLFLRTRHAYQRKQRREEPLDDPLPLYKGITPDDWKEFVKQRMDEKFKEKSRKAQESQKHNLHPHYMGRAGYIGKMEGWYQEELNDALTDDIDADPAVIEETVRQRLEDRGYLWIKGHTPSSKDVSSHTEELISEINYWDEMNKRGEFVPSEREDVLVKATGKFDRPGFTRGVGGSVGFTSFFGKSNNPRANKKLYTEDDFRLFKEAVKKEAMVDVQSLVKQHVSEILKDHLQSKSSNDIKITKTKDVSSSQVQNSCHSTKLDDHFLELEGPIPCRLAVFVAESKIVVAEGTIWPWVEGNMVHNTPLTTCQNLHVSIDHIIDGNALLPGQFRGMNMKGLDDPMARDEGQHVTPKETAKPTSEKMHTSARKKVQEVVDHERLEDMICSAYSGGYSLFTIEISNLVYSYESPIKLIIMFDDIREIFIYEWLNISILQLWGSFLYEYGTQCGVTKELVGFLCPDRVCTYMHSSVEMERYLTAALKKQQDKRYVISAFYES
ncbi:hypothetical protein KSS87_022259 [Heliosperma pusillum]|nr:hypothetical protein KSS87_022259 [Heliosperma pusillum]